MAEKKFKFVSPGIFLEEIDNSQLPDVAAQIGPLVIGRTERGPAMRPVRVDSFSDFVEIFGNPIPGGKAGDVWRDGNYLSPTYAAYAAQAWLKNNTPCTVIRLLGTKHPQGSSGGLAGWDAGDLAVATAGGAYGLFVSNWNGDPSGSQATAGLTMADGDLATENQFTEGEYIIITDTAGTKRVYVLCDGSESGASATGTVLVEGTDMGAAGLPAATAALGTCVAVLNNLNTHSQAVVLNEIKAAIAHANGHNGTITMSADVSVTTGEQTITLTQALGGAAGNTVTTTNIDELTAADFTGGTENTFNLAAVFYTTSDFIALSGNVGATGATSFPTASNAVAISASSGDFTVSVASSQAAVANNTAEKIVFNFDKNSDKFIRKVFSTNPAKTNSTVYSTTKGYWLGETFERQILTSSVNDTKCEVLGDITHGIMMGLATPGGKQWANRQSEFRDPRTGWFVAQDMGTAASFEPQSAEKLFRLIGLNHGEWLRKNLKVSIEDIKPPKSDHDRFGTFTVTLRRITDKDVSPELVERYSGCNLNPNSPNYVTRKIGDQYVEWDATERRYRSYGSYPNMSKFIRVDVKQVVSSGEAQELMPFGVFGPPRINALDTIKITGDVGNYGFLKGDDDIVCSHNDTRFLAIGQGGAASAVTNPVPLTASYNFPVTPCRVDTTQGSLSRKNQAYWGVATGQSGSYNVFDNSFPDALWVLPEDLDSGDTDPESSDHAQVSWVFTLDDLVLTDSTGVVTWVSGSRKFSGAQSVSGPSISANSGSSSVLTGSAYKFNRFTTVFHGGSDGLDIKEKDPFRNTGLSGGEEKTNYAYFTIKRAIDTVRDPELVEFNLASVPGVTNPSLTSHLINTCEDRADALAIIDIEKDFIPDAEGSSAENTTARQPNVDEAVTTLQNRALNSSYGAAYYPFVQIRDNIADQYVNMPPSVVALGTIGSSETSRALWFAPAGFTRGGLSEGAAGLPVLAVKHHLTSKERDLLYEANINPIASFPAEGVVVFGQKTLQVVPSALDRVNVRRLLIYIKKEVSRIAATTLFEQNVSTTWDSFRSRVSSFLEGIKGGQGLMDFKVILDKTTTTPELIDRNIMYAKVFLKPAKAIEFIALDFVITDSGASFAD